jgi:hypothetical protein
MASSTVQEIERAIVTLTAQELEELYLWLDQYEHPFYARIQSDLAAGRLDNAIERALARRKTRSSPAALAPDASPSHCEFLGALQPSSDRYFAIVRTSNSHCWKPTRNILPCNSKKSANANSGKSGRRESRGTIALSR